MYLIELWSEDSIQVQIEGCGRNREVYVKLAEQMKRAGYSRTGMQCLYKHMASLRTKEHAYYLAWLAFLYTSCEQELARFTSQASPVWNCARVNGV